MSFLHATRTILGFLTCVLVNTSALGQRPPDMQLNPGIIIDLRKSSGGSADMVVFMASYFFDEEPFHLGDWFVRAENRVQQWWTLPYVPGSRYVGKDVYILLSRRSFSAVEGLASLLQHHKRAVIVGEKTSGGTHPGRMVRVHPNFAVFVPMSWFIYPTGTPSMPIDRPVYPTTKTDYEGTPVTPDIAVPATQALKRAHFEALNKRIERDPTQKGRLEPIIQTLKKELEEMTPVSGTTCRSTRWCSCVAAA